MSLTAVLDERVHFARDIRPEVNLLLQSAVACADDFERARAHLYEALALDPGQLEIYVALYKFCFYRGCFDEAEQIALAALTQAATDGGFSSNWRQLEQNTTDWKCMDSSVRLYLYSLKALAFIRLRMGNNDGAREVLDSLARLDPDDQVGGSVIMTLAEAL